MTEKRTILTWREIAIIWPEFVQWVVQRYGGVPDGPINKEEYREYREYLRAFLDERFPNAE